jgi:hypothetical protein
VLAGREVILHIRCDLVHRADSAVLFSMSHEPVGIGVGKDSSTFPEA